MSLSDVGGTLWHRRPGVEGSDVRFPTHLTHLLCFQMCGAGGTHHDLVIELEHESAISEAYDLLELLLRHRDSP
jgi:hypothetical protein